MFRKLFFLGYFLFNGFYIISGLTMMRGLYGPAINFIYLILFLYIVWSIKKIYLYTRIKNDQKGFLRYYFSYLIDAIYIIGEDRSFGPSPTVNYLLVLLSVIGGIGGLSIAVVGVWQSINLSEAFLSNTPIFFYLVIIPAGYAVLASLIVKSKKPLTEVIFASVMIKIFFFFLYALAVVMPPVWFMIFFCIFLDTKITLQQRNPTKTQTS